jgi:peptidoglycan/xylan/chitin deacetylase (PgdA/CDA1 family)
MATLPPTLPRWWGVGNLDGHSFGLCLTHDVDRPYKRLYQALYYTVRDRDDRHLREYLAGKNPFWQFDAITSLEADLGVRSAFYFLNEPRLLASDPETLLDSTTWLEKLGRYDVVDPAIAGVIRDLDAGGWEVGLHGSYHTARNRDRLRTEKERIESVLGHAIAGGRQHHLRHANTETWRHYRALGLQYDASLGSTTDYGFDGEYWVRRPFNDDFVLFPLTLMEQTLPDPAEHFDRAWEICESLLTEAAANDAVMTVLWHPRLFADREFPGYRRLYRRLVGTALDRDAWVGPPADFYETFLAGGPRQEPVQI